MLSDKDLDTIFRTARTYNAWQDKPVSDVTLQAIYDLLRWGPTSANSFPLRLVFARSDAARQRLSKHMNPGNDKKVLQAPVTAILAYDLEFYEKLPKLFPHNPGAREWFAGKEDHARTTAFRNSSLQGGYFIIAARALGLDCGPMSGFNNETLDTDFFSSGTVKSNFVCSIGYGAEGTPYARSPRPAFDDVCDIL